jgi:hypothetical protein
VLVEIDAAVSYVSANRDHSLLVTTAGELYAFGYGEPGALGVLAQPKPYPEGDMFDNGWKTIFCVNKPRKVPGIPIKVSKCAAGADFSLALTQSGAIYSFGANQNGALGHGDTKKRLKPTLIESSTGLVFVAIAASEHSMAITSKGGLYTWCVRVAAAQWFTIVIIMHVSCFSNSTPHFLCVFARGANSHGQCGYGATYNLHQEGQSLPMMVDSAYRQLVPEQVVALADQRIISVSAADHSSIAVSAEGVAYHFGGNFASPTPTVLPALLREHVVEASSFAYTHSLYAVYSSDCRIPSLMNTVFACGTESAACGLGQELCLNVPQPIAFPPVCTMRRLVAVLDRLRDVGPAVEDLESRLAQVGVRALRNAVVDGFILSEQLREFQEREVNYSCSPVGEVSYYRSETALETLGLLDRVALLESLTQRAQACDEAAEKTMHTIPFTRKFCGAYFSVYSHLKQLLVGEVASAQLTFGEPIIADAARQYAEGGGMVALDMNTTSTHFSMAAKPVPPPEFPGLPALLGRLRILTQEASTAAKLRFPFQRVSTPACKVETIAAIVKQVAAGEYTRAPELQGLQKALEEEEEQQQHQCLLQEQD